MTAEHEARAAVAVARAKLGHAARAVRKAARAVAQADDGFDSFGYAHVTARNREDAQALVDAAIAEHGEADVVVLTPIPHSITAPEGAQSERNP